MPFSDLKYPEPQEADADAGYAHNGAEKEEQDDQEEDDIVDGENFG